MTSKEIRQRFLDFFEKRGHKIVPSSSLIPQDSSVLFTTAGMQQFKPYYLGEKSPYGPNVVSCQKCFRTSDIEEVGDINHLTFLEMLGNFSFGGYFKEEAIKLAYEFIFKELKMPLDKAFFTVFEGDKDVPEDKESISIWKKLGIKEENIKKFGRKDNFWGPTGQEGPCGPNTEIHFYHNDGETEVWNLVFNEYYQDRDKKLIPLKQKGVDTGMGFERLAMMIQNKNSVYETDLFSPIISEIPGKDERAKRIIADHIKSSVFLISEGIFPSNIERGYVLRRILRRTVRYGKLVSLPKNFLIPLAQETIEIYKDIYPEVKLKENDILTAIQNEEEKFEKTLKDGLKKAEKILNAKIPISMEAYSKIMQLSVKEKNEAFRKVYRNRKAEGETNDFLNFGIKITSEEIYNATINGQEAFDLYQTHGFPIEMIVELAQERRLFVDIEDFREEVKKHQEISRTGVEQKFKGGLVDNSEQTIKYHTAAHLMLAALRQILGLEIYQKGSNITAERLRFDFNYPQKLTEEQIKRVEDLVNQKIKEDIKVEMIEMPKNQALKIAKVSFDPAKYGDIVKVYKIGDFSIEFCGGPHIDRTGGLGHFKVIKEESSGAGVRRIRAILE